MPQMHVFSAISGEPLRDTACSESSISHILFSSSCKFKNYFQR
jgi:hypothetical protein